MEISARVLREVEFNSSLRGYNTDEVDEFLEQVADAVERLHAEAKSAAERAEAADRSPRDRGAIEDDDSIRRTLVLAQRTADLAIREAQEEAGQMLDRARAEAETLVGDARDSAMRISSDAERRLQEEVARLGASRDELRKEVDTLVTLLGTERERLTETLGAALRYVERSLSPSAEVMSVAASATRTTPEAPAREDGDQPAPEADTEADESEGRAGGGDGDGAATGAASDGAAVLEAPSATSEAPVTAPETTEDDGDRAKPAVLDDLEAAIAEDAAAAAPTYARQSEPEHYDWDSVIRGRPEPLFGDRGQLDRPNLTAVPSMDEPAKDTASTRSRRRRGSNWPA
ncbi:MAG: DivIVA domain-containing protein [Acidimicrobiales bacterium]